MIIRPVVSPIHPLRVRVFHYVHFGMALSNSNCRYFISCLLGTLKMNGLEVAGTMDLSRHNNDKSTFLLRQCQPQVMPHMCVSLNKTNRVRLIVSSSDISEEDELHLTTKVTYIINYKKHDSRLDLQSAS